MRVRCATSSTEKATELKHDADEESLKAIKNVFADLAGLIAFAVVCFLSRDELRVLRGFVDEAVYGLSDSAKAFAIILFTDIFVGYHSPEGWSVLLGRDSRAFRPSFQPKFRQPLHRDIPGGVGDDLQVLDF